MELLQLRLSGQKKMWREEIIKNERHSTARVASCRLLERRAVDCIRDGHSIRHGYIAIHHKNKNIGTPLLIKRFECFPNQISGGDFRDGIHHRNKITSLQSSGEGTIDK